MTIVLAIAALVLALYARDLNDTIEDLREEIAWLEGRLRHEED